MDVIRERKKGRWNTKRKGAFVGAGVFALVVILFLWGLGPALPSVPAGSILIDTVKRGEMVRKISAPGTLVAVETRLIPSILPKAQVERLLIQPGTAVDADSVLLRMSNPQVQQQYDEAKLKMEVGAAELQALKNKLMDNLLNQESKVALARSNYEETRLQADREGMLVKDNIVSEIQYKKSMMLKEQLGIQLEVELKRMKAIPQLNTSELKAKTAELSLLQRQLDLQQKLVDSMDVKAGIDGIVQEIRVKEGQGVDQGEILALVARQERLKAEVRVIESQAREVVVGQKVAIDFGNSSEAGTVSRIDPSVLNGTVIVDVTFVGKPPRGARANLRVNATIEIERLKNVLYIGKPAQARENAQVKLFKIDGSGVARLTDVGLGRASAATVEIVSGLAEGDRIVLSDVSDLSKSDQFKLD